MSRPTFYYKRNQRKPIVAGGILFYTMDTVGEIHFLLNHELGKNKKTYMSDLGGKTDTQDRTILDTILREATEETNCAFVDDVYIQNRKDVYRYLDIGKQKLNRLITDSPKKFVIYNNRKYLLYLVYIEMRHFHPLSKFSTREFVDNFDRDIRLVSLDEFRQLHRQKKLNPRLTQPSILKYINKNMLIIENKV